MKRTIFVLACLTLAACQTDDERYQSFGAKPGTSDYIHCRATLAKNEDDAAAQAAMTGAMMGVAASNAGLRR